MSGAGDDRWRGGRGYDHGRPQGQRHHSGGYRDRQSGSHGHRNQMNNNMTATAAWTGPPSGPSREPHTPVRGFNSAESKDALKKDYKKGGQGEPQPVIYRPTGKDGNPVRPSGPWGSKPNSMANGKDFFLELRKQISGLQQSNVQGG
ncbi:hypothetical protein MGYG_06127 [Nannizzia gypsea CBS 118893]|uniref:Uncharacterized protein n=1 Tax=Arthroderma gypseum (strain ATCC MYA-4604 / CBS 118893) TaxID=535722 RepID=E4V0J6_ARTGP|nr:hypothetical protein MGYG_06127 [Nannizzia gypsea CBS 118893]EFR03133.1 hypothetical protein MGYG_06127 [Nannizzia gypsea CBS 118893]